MQMQKINLTLTGFGGQLSQVHANVQRFITGILLMSEMEGDFVLNIAGRNSAMGFVSDGVRIRKYGPTSVELGVQANGPDHRYHCHLIPGNGVAPARLFDLLSSTFSGEKFLAGDVIVKRLKEAPSPANGTPPSKPETAAPVAGSSEPPLAREPQSLSEVGEEQPSEPPIKLTVADPTLVGLALLAFLNAADKNDGVFLERTVRKVLTEAMGLSRVPRQAFGGFVGGLIRRGFIKFLPERSGYKVTAAGMALCRPQPLAPTQDASAGTAPSAPSAPEAPVETPRSGAPSSESVSPLLGELGVVVRRAKEYKDAIKGLETLNRKFKALDEEAAKLRGRLKEIEEEKEQLRRDHKGQSAVLADPKFREARELLVTLREALEGSPATKAI